MNLRPARIEEFNAIRSFYWELIDSISAGDATVGWKKGIYPSDSFLMESIQKQEMYVLDWNNGYAACVVINHTGNDGYEGIPWGIRCTRSEVLVPHALAVHPKLRGRGIGTEVMEDIISMAKINGMKTIRLDILKGNQAAERLYEKSGFQYVQTKVMFYEDTGWTDFRMYELILANPGR